MPVPRQQLHTFAIALGVDGSAQCGDGYRGEQQRAAIARAVVSKPDILIADEPTGNVDPAMGHRLLRLFAELNKLGTTVLIATHDVSLVRSMRVPVMELGEGCLTVTGRN